MLNFFSFQFFIYYIYFSYKKSVLLFIYFLKIFGLFLLNFDFTYKFIIKIKIINNR